jgi:hypothetical protein
MVYVCFSLLCLQDYFVGGNTENRTWHAICLYILDWVLFYSPHSAQIFTCSVILLQHHGLGLLTYSGSRFRICILKGLPESLFSFGLYLIPVLELLEITTHNILWD